MTTMFHSPRAHIGYDAMLAKLTDEEVEYRKAEYKEAFYDKPAGEQPKDQNKFRLRLHSMGNGWVIEKRVWWFFWEYVSSGYLANYERVKDLYVYSGHFTFIIENRVAGYRYVKTVLRT